LLHAVQELVPFIKYSNNNNMASSSTSSAAALIHRRLYRALMRATKPFTPPSPDYAVLSCLLHRSFISIEYDEMAARYQRGEGQKRDKFMAGHYLERGDAIAQYAYADQDEDHIDPTIARRHDAQFLLFRRLLWTYFSESDTYDETCWDKPIACYQYPYQVRRRPYRLRDLIRREFRVPVVPTVVSSDDESSNSPDGGHQYLGYFSGVFSVETRRETAFLALRKLNEKLTWAEQLKKRQHKKVSSLTKSNKTTTTNVNDNDNQLLPSPKQAAKHVEPIVFEGGGGGPSEISSHIKPGIFLVAHPHMTGFFRRSVICILQYGQDKDVKKTDEDQKNTHKQSDMDDFGAYGIVINRSAGTSETTGRHRTLRDVLPILPKELVTVFGKAPIREGGPVHVPSIQMMHSTISTSSSSTASSDFEENTATSKESDASADQESRSNLGEIGGSSLPFVKGQPEGKNVFFQGDVVVAAQHVNEGKLDQGMFSVCSRF